MMMRVTGNSMPFILGMRVQVNGGIPRKPRGTILSMHSPRFRILMTVRSGFIPTRHRTILHLKEMHRQTATIELFDGQGRRVLEQRLTGRDPVPVGKSGKGNIYIQGNGQGKYLPGENSIEVGGRSREQGVRRWSGSLSIEQFGPKINNVKEYGARSKRDSGT